jgi:hypothetical protein
LTISAPRRSLSAGIFAAVVVPEIADNSKPAIRKRPNLGKNFLEVNIFIIL